MEYERSLAYLYPEVAKEWDYEKNNYLKPEMLTAHSGKKAWWKCKDGHSWDATIFSRTRKKANGCPYCSGRRAIPGETDLKTMFPKVVEEWDYEKNEGLKPEMFTAHSSKRVWWKCKEGHSWYALISSRTRREPVGCPCCSGRIVIPGETDLKTLFPEIAKEWDYEKNVGLEPEKILAHSHQKVWWKCKEGHSWDGRIDGRTGKKALGCPYCSGKRPIPGETDLKTLFPEVAKEWDYEKNEGLIPEMFTAHSGEKVWWKCNNGHSWDGRIDGRTGKKALGCPYCSGRRPIQGETDLKTLFPEIAKEWDYEKNEGLKPEMFTAHSSKKVWWKCKEGHSWKATIRNRVDNNSGCVICAGRKPVLGETDLKTIFPAIENEWDYEKNNKLRPEMFTAHSGKKVWWKCKEGHSWKTTINDHTRKGRGACPYCSGKYPIVGETDFKSLCPEIAKEWDYEKNNKLRPEMFTAHSGKKVWWKCNNGHSWRTSINHRSKGRGCPVCNSK